jgi:hypothetical protein
VLFIFARTLAPSLLFAAVQFDIHAHSVGLLLNNVCEQNGFQQGRSAEEAISISFLINTRDTFIRG